MTKRILIVGCGSIGERHLRCLMRVGQVQPAVCEPNPEVRHRVQHDYAVPVFAGLEEALAGDPCDGAIICTPADTHVNLALKALRHNLALLIEKPLSTGFDRLDELQAETRRTGKFVGVAYVYHFVPAVQAVRDFLSTKTFGRPLHVSVAAGQHFPAFRPAYRDIYYRNHKAGGGAIQDALTHLANTVEWLIGPTDKLFCEAAHQALEGVNVEDTVSVTAKNGGILVSYSLNQFQAPNETTIHIHCGGGSVKIEIHEQRWAIFPHGAKSWDYRPAPVADRDDLFTAQAAAFLDGMAGKPNPLCTLDEAIQTLKFNVAAIQSARTGAAVELAGLTAI
jgi:predicted dehydrogenase